MPNMLSRLLPLTVGFSLWTTSNGFLLRSSQGSKSEDFKALLLGINEVAQSLENEQKKFEASSKDPKKCQEASAELDKSIAGEEETAKEVKSQIQASQVGVQSLKDNIGHAQKRIDEIEGQSHALEAQLRDLRKRRAEELARDRSYTKEAKAVLKKAKVLVETDWSRKHEEKAEGPIDEKKKYLEAKEVLADTTEVSSSSELAELKALEESLASPSFLQVEDDSGFSMQRESLYRFLSDSKQSDRESQNTINSAEEALDSASAAQESFENEEMRLITLIKEKRSQLVPLQEELGNLQPELADGVRKLAEANRTLSLLKRSGKRDIAIQTQMSARCKLLTAAHSEEKGRRSKAIAKLHQVISVLSGYAKAAGFKLPVLGSTSPSFLQLSSESEVSESVEAFMRALNGKSSTEGQDGEDPAMSVSSESVAEVTLQASEPKPLDPVRKTVRALVAALSEGRRDARNKHRFCVSETERSRSEGKQLQRSLEEAKDHQRWAENAVADIKDEMKFLKVEALRLEGLSKNGFTDLNSENDRLARLVPKLTTAVKALKSSHKVLDQLCPKDTRCVEAGVKIEEVQKDLAGLDSYLSRYIVKLTKLTATQKEETLADLETKQSDLKAASADLMRFEDELAGYKADVFQAKKNLALFEKAKKTLEESCEIKIHSVQELKELKQVLHKLDEQGSF